jgi:hypothetical protein
MTHEWTCFTAERYKTEGSGGPQDEDAGQASG